MNLSINSWKKIKTYRTKVLKVRIAQENHFQIAIVIINHNRSIEIVFAEEQQIDKSHNFTRKTDIADQIAKTISIKTNTQDQTQTEVIIQIITRIALIRILGITTVPKTVQEIHVTIKIETILTIEIETIQINETEVWIIDHKTSNNRPFYNIYNKGSRDNS